MSKEKTQDNTDKSVPVTDKPKEYKHPACWNDHDNWSSCCSSCPYWGEPYKPCDVCEEFYE